MSKNKRLAGLAVAILILVVAAIFLGKDKKAEKDIIVKVQRGPLKMTVTTTGELEAKNSEKILGPDGLNQVGIWRTTIEDIIADGSLVDSGQYVARLDQTEISNKIKDKETELEKLETQVTKTRIDTSIEMRSARDELVNLKYALEERRIVLEQSKYEPPATIRQSEINLEKAERAYEQAIKNYKLRYDKNRANMQDVQASYDQAQRQLENMLRVRKGFTVLAPKSGMLIYRRNWDGKKMGVGAQVSTWDNTVATLPDLSRMISKTYVNEIDISKVKTGQAVEISIDAFPDKKLSGTVVEVANIGEQIQGSNAKVFEVIISVNEFDSILRPAMTTKNAIITREYSDVVYVPIEAVRTEGKHTFVLKGNRKVEIRAGESNETHIIVEEGIAEGDDVYLSTPLSGDKWEWVYLKKPEPADVQESQPQKK